MSATCIPPEELGSLEDLPADHPARAHLAGCASCQARWKAYRSFLEDDLSLPGARDAEAAAALDRLIRREFADPAKVRAGRSRAGTGRWRIRFLVPALAAAAAVFAVLVVGKHSRPGDAVLRGEAPGAAIRFEQPAPLPGGGLRLAWSSMPGADAYRVDFLDLALDPVGERPAGPDTSMVFHLADLARPVAPGTRILCRVIALRKGEEIGTSPPKALDIP